MLTLAEDKLKRENLINNLFNIFETFGNQNDRGLTMVINGRYGSGKSTLLDFIEEKNSQDNKFNIIKYDSWENNFFENPLIPVLYSISKLKSNNEKIKEGAKLILKNIPKIIFSTLANVHGVDLQSLCTNETIFDEYDAYKKSITKFKNILKTYCEDKKTILLVDELDRCLPEYQIKVLETLYHLLDIPNLIVVIALDKSQLEFAIQNKFGRNQDICGYLTKFIQYEIDLPEESTYDYIKQLMTFKSEYLGEIKGVIAGMFRTLNISIRECQMIINELNLICNEKNQQGEQIQYLYWYPVLVALLLIFKKTNNILFKKYYGKEKLRENYYANESIQLKNSKYGEFLNDIEQTDIKKLIDYLLSDAYGQGIMLHVINTIEPVRKISIDDLAIYIKSDTQRVQSLINDPFSKLAQYPDMINKLIIKMKILQ